MKFKSLMSRAIISFLSLSILLTSLPREAVYADSFKSVTLGGDLSDSQKKDMLKYFGVVRMMLIY
jgi:Predicted secreted protein